MNKAATVFFLAFVFLGSHYRLYSQNSVKNDTSQVGRLLRLAATHTSKLQTDSVSLDSALTFTTEAINLSKKLKYDSGLVRSYVAEYQIWTKVIKQKAENETGYDPELDKLNSLEGKILALLDGERHYSWLGETFLTLAKSHYDYTQQTYDYKLALYERSISYFQKAGELAQEAIVWYRMGYTHHVNSELGKAEEAYLQSLKLSDEAGEKETQHIYAILGNIYAFTGDFNLALKYELDALRISEENNDTLGLGNIHLYLGLIYEPLKERASALKHYQIALNEFKKDVEHHRSDLGRAAGNTAKMMIALNDPQGAITLLNETLAEFPYLKTSSSYSSFPMRFMQAYFKLNDIAKAQHYCDELLLINAKSPSLSILSATIRFLVDTRQYRTAELHLPAFQKMAETRELKKNMADAYYFNYQVDSAKKDYQSALKHHLMYTAMNNELFTENKSKEITALSIQYDTEQKEKDIQLLQQQSLLDKSAIEKGRILRNSTWIGILFLVTILGLVYNQNRTRKKNNKHLEHLLVEKELLLKEVHHRVKNNLQTVLSLLESQSRNLKDDALTAISETQSRVYTMSLIHKKLYQSEDVAAIDIKDYLTELVQHLRDSYGSTSVRIVCSVDPIVMDVSQAVPIGLIINEAVTNSMKYAFRESNRDNEIRIEMTNIGNLDVVLKIEDNGRSNSFDINGKGLGLKLIRGLTEDLEGLLAINSDDGMKIIITFSRNTPLHKMHHLKMNVPA